METTEIGILSSGYFKVFRKRSFQMLRTLSMMFLVGVLSVSCLGSTAQQGAAGGAAGGAVLGQILGNDTEATLLGAAIGGVLGYMVGNEMDKYDRQRLNNVYETGPSNNTNQWVNPDTGNTYSVTPQPAYKDRVTNRDCRTAQIEAVIDGKREITESVACRENGRWVLQQ